MKSTPAEGSPSSGHNHPPTLPCESCLTLLGCLQESHEQISELNSFMVVMCLELARPSGPNPENLSAVAERYRKFALVYPEFVGRLATIMQDVVKS